MERDVETEVISLLSRNMRIDEDMISMESLLNEKFGVDSVQAVTILFDLEDHFDIQIPNEDVQGLKRVGDIVRYVQSKLEQ